MASSSIAGDTVYDFWEAVTCAKCHLRFVPDDGRPPLAPFWITECGHILCNNHLNADQSCSHCGDKPINLAPLQREMEPPISDWFRSLPYAIDSIANSVKFQQATMGSLIKYYREKIHKQRSIIEQCKKERAELIALRSINDQLRQENEHMRNQLEYIGNSDPGDLNRPAKRPRTDYYGNSFSSPRRMSTPVRPDRLTFPPDHQEPNLSRSDDGYQNDTIPPNERPGSRRFQQKYTYNPPGTSQPMQSMTVSHDQTRNMVRPGKSPPPPQQHQLRRHHHHGHPHAHHTHKHRKVMPPPPTPRRHPVEVPRSSAVLPPPVSAINPVSTPLMPPRLNNLHVQRPVPMTPTSAPQRFNPPPSVSRLNTVANRQSAAQGHRIPFVPNGA